uniref:Ectonucleoside triphosphate diphosphohydrolase 1 n=1 Tax=Spermophilus dauricus TaxID=99837 RepID=A0A8C9Q6T5_SPEDA
PETNLTKKSFCSRNILIILGFSCVISVIALIAVGISHNKSLSHNVKYGIVLDAGSSHTSLYIFSWASEKENDTGIVQQIEECKVSGAGIAAYYRRPNDITTRLTQCMEKARKMIPMSKHQETPVYMGASAGMRLLRMASDRMAGKVMAAVIRNLNNYPFNFQGATIITGQEEGAYGWITINYLLGHFFFEGINHEKNFGVLNLGSDSTQITFVPKNHTMESPENSLQFRLYGKDYYVYTHSFLCYGKDQALWQKLAKDIQMLSDGVLRDPCFHPGYEEVVTVKALYETPCTRRFKKILPFNSFQIQGAGNYEQCQQRILELFNTSYCPYSQCAFNGVFLPPFQGSFGAFSVFYFVMDFFNLTSEKVSQEEAIRRIGNFCSQPWNEVKTSFPKVDEKELSEYCFSGIYILSLFTYGYHFTNKTWENIHFMGKIRGTNAGWTLGYMLNMTNMIPAEQPFTAPLSHSTYVFLMFFFSLLLAIEIIAALFILNKPAHLWEEMV